MVVRFPCIKSLPLVHLQLTKDTVTVTVSNQSNNTLSFQRRARCRSPSPLVPQHPSSSDTTSAAVPASPLLPRGMLKRRDAAEYNPSCRKTVSTSFLPLLVSSRLRSSALLQLRRAALQCPCCHSVEEPAGIQRRREGCCHTECPGWSEGMKRERRKMKWEGFWSPTSLPLIPKRLGVGGGGGPTTGSKRRRESADV